MTFTEADFRIIQQQVCSSYGAAFLESPFDHIVGIALDSFKTFEMPVNGLRNPLEVAGYAEWYLWCGEFSDADDFFQPVHVHHLLQLCPKAIRYLGLAPGWRFLFDNVYEDVWYDENLLNISS
ncbi:hypothetical protein LZZ85_00780 [Terrimonas sp. NA20]|uniref:Imm33-like domain-containing protein n=1 Tax=Terrimonas ginsenosidimutans TaxID=2908004 RepID=A0ABS9KKD3_9BACT|nr:hypothetical protein [Terrimonas ginsenosidimutans]MCG2612785.1 hypothetical protein [Terrimonas ginsenosidimutans]